LSCDKCDDIHVAQRAGKTDRECKCSCHKEMKFPTTPCPDPWYPPFYPPSPIWTYPQTVCCPCTDPANIGVPMGLVCNCICHGNRTTCGADTTIHASHVDTTVGAQGLPTAFEFTHTGFWL